MFDDTSALAEAVKGVYDAHNAPDSRRIHIEDEITALSRAKIVAEEHVYHNGTWELGSCDAELFALEWEILLAEAPKRRVSWLDRLLKRMEGD